MDTDITRLDIEWAEAMGHRKSVGSPYLFCWLHWLDVPQLSIADGRVSAIVRDHRSPAWTEYSGVVTRLDGEALLAAVVALGLADRSPRVESVPDSSDTWFASRVHVAVGETSRTFEVHTECSGFRGADAEALRALFQRVLTLAGYSRDDTMFFGRG